MPDFVRNEGKLFGEERFAEITSSPEWQAERIEDSRLALEELLEKREQQIEEGMSERDTQYYWVSYVLRAMGFVYSVAEMTPGDALAEDVRPDFMLFYSADEFRSAQPHRGEREFFAQALGVMRVFAWDANLDEYEEEQEGPANPAYEIDRLIRNTGVNWGILTNGRMWRLYHRESSGLFSSFYEVDLIQALQSPNMDAFKYFWAVFSPEGLGGYDGDEALVHRLLH